MLRSWVNGVADGRVDPADRGLQYGDGLFETIAVAGGALRQWPRHWARLRLGCERLSLPLPDPALLGAELAAAAAVPGAGVVKLTLTRGAGGRGYRAPEAPAATRVIAAYPAPAYPPGWASEGVVVRYCETRLALQPALAGLKHLNRLEQVLARSEWQAPEPAEGLMLDTQGRVVCGTMSNLFIVSGARWRTPRVDRCGVAGTMRAALIEAAAREGTTVAEADLTPADVAGADELLLTNAVFGVWPVARLDGRRYRVGEAARRARDWVLTLA